MPRLLVRLLVALVASVLALSALAPAATAAKAPKLPSLKAATTVYPFLADGKRFLYKMKVDRPAKDCGRKAVQGAVGRNASYVADSDGDGMSSAAEPSISLSAIRFASVKDAKLVMRTNLAMYKNCGGDPGEKPETTTFKVKVGAQSWGITTNSIYGTTTYVDHALMARVGKLVVCANIGSADGEAPDVDDAIAILDLALSTAR